MYQKGRGRVRSFGGRGKWGGAGGEKLRGAKDATFLIFILDVIGHRAKRERELNCKLCNGKPINGTARNTLTRI